MVSVSLRMVIAYAVALNMRVIFENTNSRTGDCATIFPETLLNGAPYQRPPRSPSVERGIIAYVAHILVLHVSRS